MFVKCKVYLCNYGKTRRSHRAESDIGYCECFHMSKANKLSKLRGHNFSMSKKISHEAHYHFFRLPSTWAKLERDRWRPYFHDSDEWKEFCKEIDLEEIRGITDKRFTNMKVDPNGLIFFDDNKTMEANYVSARVLEDLLNSQHERIESLKQDDILFFQKVFDILLKYQDLFNREMADEVLEELGIELTKWFE